MRSPALPLEEERDPDYLPFLAGDAPPDLDIELLPGTPVLPPDARRLFSAGESWSAHAAGEILLIAPHAQPPATAPDWLAAVGTDRRSVRITCGEALIAGDHPARLHHQHEPRSGGPQRHTRAFSGPCRRGDDHGLPIGPQLKEGVQTGLDRQSALHD